MFISFNTEELSERDLQVLRVVVGDGQAPSTPVSAPKAAAATKSTPKATAKVQAAAEPADAPVESGDDADDSSDGLTVKDAIERATALVSSGEASKVKEALKKVGAKRVSEIDEAKVGVFLAELA